MSEQKGIFINKSGSTEPAPELWEPAIIKKTDFDYTMRLKVCFNIPTSKRA